MQHRVTVTTTRGRVRGVEEDGLQVFRGIPYAAPPAGPLRWMAAQPHPGWDGVRDAAAYGPTAPQPYLPEGRPIMGTHGDPPFDEDCLTLNVWTPGADDSRRPVLVWIHGGGFLTGSGNIPYYAGDTFARDGDLVVVTINYRVGPLGFLHGMGDSANLWLTDQAAALRWVVDNVTAFGGDPHQITLAGQSGGAFSIGALAQHPVSRGLFQRGILQSPPMGLELPHADEAIVRTRALARRLGHDHVDGLRDEPWQRLIDATISVVAEFSEFGEWALAYLPVLDPDTMPLHPADALARSDIELIIGWTEDEATLAFATEPAYAATPRAAVESWMAKRHGDRAAAALYDAYAAAHPEPRPLDVLIDAVSDDLFKRASRGIVERRAEAARPVHAFEFALDCPAFDGVFGATHCGDLPFSFANFGRWGDRPIAQDYDPDVRDRLSAAMHDAWIAFARSGDPDHPRLPPWPVYSAVGRETLILSDEVRVVSGEE